MSPCARQGAAASSAIAQPAADMPLIANNQLAIEMLVQITSTLARHDQKFDAIDARFDKVDARFDALDAKVAGLDARVAVLDTKVAVLDTKAVVLDARMTTLEASVVKLDGEVKGLASNVKDLVRWKERIWGMVIMSGWLAAAGAGAWALLGRHVTWSS